MYRQLTLTIILASTLVTGALIAQPVSAEVFHENVLTNSKFDDDLAGWITHTVTTADLGDQYALDGQYLTLGRLDNYQAIGQIFTVPEDAGRATFSFYYRLYTADTTSNDYLTITFSVPDTDLVLLSKTILASDGDVSDWTQYSVDASTLIGREVYVSLVVRNDAELFTFVDLDNIRLHADSYGELSGTVKDGDGNGVRNAQVTIRKPNGDKIWTGTTNKKGKFTATQLPGKADKYSVIIKKNEVTFTGKAHMNWGELTTKVFTIDSL